MKKPGSLRRVDIKELEAELGRGEPLLLLDVRTAPEFSRGHVPGAINVPLADIDQGKLPPEGSVPVWLICRSGARSARAAQVLVDWGWRPSPPSRTSWASCAGSRAGRWAWGRWTGLTWRCTARPGSG
jgi:rhodanese-related sulfurtransferase